MNEPVRGADGTYCCPYVCMWCARHRVVTLSGGRLEAKTCGRFPSYPATDLDVSEAGLAFLLRRYVELFLL